MPILHVLVSLVALAVLARVAFLTFRTVSGRPANSRQEQIGLGIVGILASWQAWLWLSTAHPDATFAFRSGVILQLLCAASIAALSILQLALSRHHRPH